MSAVEAYDETDSEDASTKIRHYPVSLALRRPSVDEKPDWDEKAERKHKWKAILGKTLCRVVIDASGGTFPREWLAGDHEGLVGMAVGGG